MVVAASAQAQTVVDGDTIKLNGTTVRIWGIDAPELDQRCGHYPAGKEAARALAEIIAGRVVTCEARATDRYGRTVALCRAGVVDIGEAMVRRGMAWAFTRYSGDYVSAESKAKAEAVGIHGQICIPAWEWRAAKTR